MPNSVRKLSIKRAADATSRSLRSLEELFEDGVAWGGRHWVDDTLMSNVRRLLLQAEECLRSALDILRSMDGASARWKSKQYAGRGRPRV